MQTVQREISGAAAVEQMAALQDLAPQLVLAFWNGDSLATPAFLPILRESLPHAVVIGCTTAGQISRDGIGDNSALLTAVRFDYSTVHAVETDVLGALDSYAAGARLATSLPREDLRAVLLLAPGVHVNGSALIEGLTARLPHNVAVCGGLAGDAGNFERTYVLGPGGIAANRVVAVGLYGERLQFGMGRRGGWSPLGPLRLVTRVDGPSVLEIDDQPALALYKKYLGEQAGRLPASALAYPLEILGEKHNTIGLLRMVTGVDEAAQSLQLAGSVVEGNYARLMHADIDALIDGAENAAIDSLDTLENGLRGDEGLAFVVSCVGRRRVMAEHATDEVMVVAEQLGSGFTLAGFYAHGQLSPQRGMYNARLHNQTIAITLITER